MLSTNLGAYSSASASSASASASSAQRLSEVHPATTAPVSPQAEGSGSKTPPPLYASRASTPEMQVRLKYERKQALLEAISTYALDKGDEKFAALFHAAASYEEASSSTAGWRANYLPDEKDIASGAADLKAEIGTAVEAYEGMGAGNATKHTDEKFHSLYDALTAYAQSDEGRQVLRKQEAKRALVGEVEKFIVSRGASGLASLVEKVREYDAEGHKRGLTWATDQAKAKKDLATNMRERAHEEALKAFPDPDASSDTSEGEAIAAKRATFVSNKIASLTSDSKNLRDSMLTSIARYFSGQGGKRHSDSDFHAMYHAVMAYAECDEGKAEIKAKSTAVPAYMAAPIEPPLMQQRPATESTKLLQRIKQPKTGLLGGRTSSEENFKRLRDLMRPLENRETREHVVSELAAMFGELSKENRKRALELMREYMVPPSMHFDISPEMERLIREDRLDILLTDQTRAEAASNILKAGVVKDPVSQKYLLDFEHVLKLGRETAMTIKDPELRMRTLDEAMKATASNASKMHDALMSAGLSGQLWSAQVKTVIETLFNEASTLVVQAAKTHREAVTSTGLPDLSKLKSLENAVRHSQSACEHAWRFPDVPILGEPAPSMLAPLLRDQANLLAQLGSVPEERASRKEIEEKIPPDFFESEAFRRTGNTAPDFQSHHRKPSLDEYISQQRQVDQALAEKDMAEHPEAYANLLAAKHWFEEAWKAVEEDSDPVKKREAIAYLSRIPELQRDLRIIGYQLEIEGESQEPVVELVENSPDLRSIYDEKLKALVNQRLIDKNQREPLPGYSGK